MAVEAGEDDGVYFVDSRSEDHPHVVDLRAYEGNGFCTCATYSCNCLPNYEKNPTIIPYGKGKSLSTQCWHIAEAIKYEKSRKDICLNHEQ